MPVASRYADVVAGVDVAPGKRRLDVPVFDDVCEALDRVEVDGALVAVPHHVHHAVSAALLRRGVFVLKEKPLATTVAEADALVEVARAHGVGAITLVQRSCNPVLDWLRHALDYIGEPYWYAYDYHFCFPTMTSGWRAQRCHAIGGVLLDMGYHVLDVVTRLFGTCEPGVGQDAYCYRDMELEGLEDVFTALLQHRRGVRGVVSLSRHHFHKREELSVLGTEGSVRVTPTEGHVYDREGHMLLEYSSALSKESIADRMMRGALEAAQHPTAAMADMQHHRRLVQCVEDLYRKTIKHQDEASVHE